VEIVNKYVSEVNTDTTVTLDTFIEDKGLPAAGYVKMDIEGAEFPALKGATSLLDKSDIQLSVCTYHLDGVDEIMRSFLTERHYDCAYSPGVIAMGEKPPYFRRGMLYARK
jgi:hypothetical protein